MAQNLAAMFGSVRSERRGIRGVRFLDGIRRRFSRCASELEW